MWALKQLIQSTAYQSLAYKYKMNSNKLVNTLKLMYDGKSQITQYFQKVN